MKKLVLVCAVILLCANAWGWDVRTSTEEREAKKQDEIKSTQEQFNWWPTDAKPAPVKDETRNGYWWWPDEPGTAKPWGNRGYIYLYKVIYDYKADELPPPQPKEMRPSLLIKKIIKNVKVYFDYDKSELRPDALPILEKAVGTLSKNPQADILITGNCDARGKEGYNLKLGKKRGEAVKNYMIEHNIDESRIRIISRGKLDAAAPLSDLTGMQKERNAQFVIAEVEEVMLPYEGEPTVDNAQKIDEGKYIVEEKEVVAPEITEAKTKEYTIKKGDTLWKIAERECGAGYRWKNIFELNKSKIKDPNKLKVGTKIIIPVE